MSTEKDMINESELAKSYIVGSNMTEDQKRTYLRLISIATESTNGISQEAKIQKMTEAILLLAVSQVKYAVNMDQTIEQAIQKANLNQCKTCRAMKHAEQEDEEHRQQEIIEQWKLKNGYPVEGNQQHVPTTWADTLKVILTKPYFYIFLTLSLISPYGVQIIDRIIQLCGK